MEPWKNISCICFSKRLTEIEELVRTQGLKTVASIQPFCKVGTKCKLCVPFIEQIIKKYE